MGEFLIKTVNQKVDRRRYTSLAHSSVSKVKVISVLGVSLRLNDSGKENGRKKKDFSIYKIDTNLRW